MPELLTIRCLADNYAYLLHGGGETVLIDAPEAAPVLAALAAVLPAAPAAAVPPVSRVRGAPLGSRAPPPPFAFV